MKWRNDGIMECEGSHFVQHGQNPLHVAAEYDNESIVQLFLRVLADKNPLHLADMVKKELISKKSQRVWNLSFLIMCANVLQKGHTIAHIAAKNGSDAVMHLLLRFNQSDTVNTKNKGSDATVLHVAAAGGHVELVKMLLGQSAYFSRHFLSRKTQSKCKTFSFVFGWLCSCGFISFGGKCGTRTEPVTIKHKI